MTKVKILVFAGTYEGRMLCEYFDKQNIQATACTATEYGMSLIALLENITVHSKRLNAGEMVDFIKEYQFNIVIDCTHPYAQEVTQNICTACAETNVRYIRLLREENQYDDILLVANTLSAVETLKNTSGNVLVTTGSKELALYTKVDDFAKRLFARVLPTGEVVAHCNELGFTGRNLIAMQGPFSKDLNVAMLKQFDCKYLVTKNTGIAGGVEEKINAAKMADAKIILIDRPLQETGYNMQQVIEIINDLLAKEPK